jgi:hypothetical protein
MAAAGAGRVAEAVEHSDLEEREARFARTELVFELDEQRSEEATVHEELRVVHQYGVGPEPERRQQLERIVRGSSWGLGGPRGAFA